MSLSRRDFFRYSSASAAGAQLVPIPLGSEARLGPGRARASARPDRQLVRSARGDSVSPARRLAHEGDAGVGVGVQTGHRIDDKEVPHAPDARVARRALSKPEPLR